MRQLEWSAIFSVLESLHSYKLPEEAWTKDELFHQWIGKTLERNQTYKENYSDEFIQSIQQSIHTKLVEYVELRAKSECSSIIHGDAWLSNILFNEKNEIFFIDMRGKTSRNQVRITGDEMYDYAKIGISILGMDAAVFMLTDLGVSDKIHYWNMLLKKTPSEYAHYLPFLVYSLVISTLFKYNKETRERIIRLLKDFEFLLTTHLEF